MQIKKDRSSKLISCRACGSKNLNFILSLGSSPLANSFLKSSELKSKEISFPLNLKLCQKCGLVQLDHVVDPKVMFSKYLYISSTSSSFVRHFEKFALTVFNNFSLNKNDLVVDIGSNDGVLLKPFRKLGVKTLGVDPAKNLARIAKNSGIETVVDFFDLKTANDVKKRYGDATIITAANVFAHMNNWEELVKAVKTLLHSNGVFIIEVPYLLDFIKKNLFDTVYHEHLSYISVHPLVKFFKRHGMQVFDVQKVESHGGSIRVFVQLSNGQYPVKKSVRDFVKREKSNGLENLVTYKDFSKKIDGNKKTLVKLLSKIKAKGNRLCGYGAPAKGNTLLNYFGIGPELIDYIIDDSPLKQGLYTPGTHIPITSPDKLKNARIDYILILAWNFADKIIEKYSYLKKDGVKFIIPVPTPKIV